MKRLLKRGCALLLLLTVVLLVGGVVAAVRLLGPLFNEGANVLILFNNTDEMRGSGGFTTAYMTITRQNSQFVTHFGSSYEIDTPPDASGAVLVVPPPKPMHDYMGIDRWSFRDANWSPDYPTSAQAASRFYTQVTGAKEPLYVITINMSAARTLMQHLPPIQIKGCGNTADDLYVPCPGLTDGIILDWLRLGWNESASGPSGDKSFIKERFDRLLSGVRSLPPWYQVGVLPAVFDMLGRGDVLLYSSDVQIQEFFGARRWSGPFPLPTEGDVLLYSENNIGYNKTSSDLYREFEYEVDFTKSPPVAKLIIGYGNQAPYPPPEPDLGNCDSVDRVAPHHVLQPIYHDRMIGCAWVYGQVFPPPGSKLIDYDVPIIPPDHFPFGLRGQTGRVDAVKEAGVSGWGYVVVAPYIHAFGYTTKISLTYTLPPDITETNYHITLPSQADMKGLWYITVHYSDGTTKSGYYTMQTRRFAKDFKDLYSR